MVTADFIFEINLSGTTWTDISSYVITADWQIGLSAPYESMGRVAQANLMVLNTDRRFSPEYSSGPYYGNLTRGKAVRIKVQYGNSYNLFRGQISAIEPQTDSRGSRQATIRCVDILERAQRAEIFVPVQENKRADEVLAVILQAAGLTANIDNRWLLGMTDYSELGVSTELGNDNDLLQSEHGISTFAIIGDQWRDKTSVFGALRDTAAREYGYLFTNRSGRFIFWNRHHFILTTDVNETITDSHLRGASYSFGDDLVNEAIVPVRQRTIGTSNEVLGRLEQPVQIKIDETKTVTFRYRDNDSGISFAGKNAIEPNPGSDWYANTAKDGTGVDKTNDVDVAISEETGTSCTVDFTNNSGEDVYLLAGAQIRGIKITDYGQIDVVVSDQTSINTYELQRYTYPAALDNLPEGEALARYILAQRGSPYGALKSITLAGHTSETLLQTVIANSIGGRLTLSETQVAAGGDYFIIGETWKLADAQINVTWILQPAARSDYWILGKTNYSELAQNSLLGPF